MSNAWHLAKIERAKVLGNGVPFFTCEVCGRSDCHIIGHHLLGRKNKSYEVPELCELRDEECEVEMHRMYRAGNRPECLERIAQYKGTV